MELFLQKNVKNLLRELDIKPQKKLGQNFLVDKDAISKFIDAAGIQKDDTVIEIGPGIGNLTQELAKKAKKVIAVEKDREMVEILKKQLENACPESRQRIKIVEGDIRNLKPGTLNLKSGGYKVVANIPYYLTAFLIRSLLESKTPHPTSPAGELAGGQAPKDITLVVQKEVARRICSKPPDMNLLAVSVQFYAKPKIISYIKKSSFWPVPKVDSAILKIQNIQNTRYKIRNTFFRIVKAGFSQPRKQLLNNLANGLKMDREEVKSWLLKNNIQPTQRAETLRVEDWINLTKDYL